MNEEEALNYTNSGIEKTNFGDFEGAIEDFDKAIELSPELALTYFSKAIALHYLSETDEAYKNYTKAIECDEKMVDAYYNRAQVLLMDLNAKEEVLRNALADLEKAYNLDSQFIDAMYYAATVKMKLEEYEEAVELLDKVIAIEPEAIYSKALKKLILAKYLKKDKE